MEEKRSVEYILQENFIIKENTMGKRGDTIKKFIYKLDSTN